MNKKIVDARELVSEVSQHLKEGYVFPVVHTAIDHEEHLELVYAFRHVEDRTREDVVLSVRVDASEPRIPSLTPMVPGLVFQEREVYDLFGVIYDGHPDLRRLLLPEGFQGHPLRKSYTQLDGDVQ